MKRIMYIVSLVIVVVSCVILFKPGCFLSLLVIVTNIFYMEKKKNEENKIYMILMVFTDIINMLGIIIDETIGMNIFSYWLINYILFFGIIAIDIIYTKQTRNA